MGIIEDLQALKEGLLENGLSEEDYDTFMDMMGYKEDLQDPAELPAPAPNDEGWFPPVE